MIFWKFIIFSPSLRCRLSFSLMKRSVEEKKQEFEETTEAFILVTISLHEKVTKHATRLMRNVENDKRQKYDLNTFDFLLQSLPSFMNETIYLGGKM